MVVEMDDATRAQVTEMFELLTNDVTIHLFTADHDCLYCNDTRDMAEMVAEVSDKVTVEEHKGSLTSGVAKELGVEHTPA
ncbi:MAG: protein disulfide oxidoreductase, partial [Candidatus Thorarchaeota archaeon]